MAQHLIQTQEQKLQQIQKLTQQQMLQVKLMEMPVAELEENVNAELDDNPALEVASPDDNDINTDINNDINSADNDFDASDSDHAGNDNDSADNDTIDSTADAYDRQQDTDLRQSALDEALSRIGSDDDMPPVHAPGMGTPATDNADYEEMVYGSNSSFYDKLKEQMGMQNLTDKQQLIMEYVIGNLDDDGLLRKTTDALCDELDRRGLNTESFNKTPAT